MSLYIKKYSNFGTTNWDGQLNLKLYFWTKVAKNGHSQRGKKSAEEDPRNQEHAQKELLYTWGVRYGRWGEKFAQKNPIVIIANSRPLLGYGFLRDSYQTIFERKCELIGYCGRKVLTKFAMIWIFFHCSSKIELFVNHKSRYTLYFSFD